jgi:uncharacterized protein YjbI with pentapeptide repeats
MATSKKKRSPPKLPSQFKEVNSFAMGAGSDSLAEVRIVGARSVLLPTLTIEQSILEKCELRSCNAQTMRWFDVVADHCDCANADFHYTVFDRIEVHDCKMTGVSLVEAKIKDAFFSSCQCEYALFRMARVSFSEFTGCNLREADFYGANLSGTVFRNCDLHSVDFTTSTLQGTDIRGCQIEGLKVNAEAVKGLIIDPAQAAYLMYLLKVKVLQ